MGDPLQLCDRALFAGDLAQARRLLRLAGRRSEQASARSLAAVLDALELPGKRAGAPLRGALADALPLPGVLLAAGRRLLRLGAIDEAARCYARLHLLGHPLLGEFYATLPATERTRYLPLARQLFDDAAVADVQVLRWAKQGLRARLSLADSASLFARAFGLPPTALQWLQIGRVDEVAAPDPAQRYEMFAAQRFRLPLPRVPGQPLAWTEEVAGRRMELCCIRDAEATGRSQLIRCGRRVVFDWQGDELEQVPQILDAEPLVLLQRAQRLAMLPGRAAPFADPLDEAFSLLGSSSIVFGHWLCEYLPRVLALLQRDLLPGVPILVDERMPAEHLASLRLFVGARNPLVTVPALARVRVRRLWVCSAPMYLPIFPWPGQDLGYRLLSAPPRPLAELFAFGRALFDRLEPGPRGTRRVYLARRATQWRRLVNHAQVEALFSAAGFEIVYPETLDFRAQLRLVRESAFLVGPEGSALMLAFFGHPGLRLAMLNHEYLENLPSIGGVMEAAGVEVSILCGETVRHEPRFPRFSDYRIAPAQIAALLHAWGLASDASESAEAVPE